MVTEQDGRKYSLVKYIDFDEMNLDINEFYQLNDFSSFSLVTCIDFDEMNLDINEFYHLMTFLQY